MLRSQAGPEVYREAIRTYLERHRNGNVETHDLLGVFEELTGRSWDEFFDQWVFHGGDPALTNDYAWEELRGQAKFTGRQTQNTKQKGKTLRLPPPCIFSAR